jgi:hypothetical protein
VLAGFAACALTAMPTLSVSAMPIAAADKMVAETYSSVILAKGGHGHGGHGHGGGWGRGGGGRAFGWSRGRKLGWHGRGCPPGLWKQGRC